jgi:hypothetical protein
MDEHVPFAITAGLSLRGVDVLTAQADSTRGSDDTEILDRAMELGRAVFTQARISWSKPNAGNELVKPSRESSMRIN